MKKVQVSLHNVQRIRTVPVITVGVGGRFELLTLDEALSVAKSLNNIATQIREREAEYTPAKPDPVPVATSTPSPVQVIACHGNVIITRHASDKFAHIDMSPGGFGLDSDGLRDLARQLNCVADQIQPSDMPGHGQRGFGPSDGKQQATSV